VVRTLFDIHPGVTVYLVEARSRELVMRLGFSFQVDSRGNPIFKPPQNMHEPSGLNELRFMRRSWVELQAHVFMSISGEQEGRLDLLPGALNRS
jgi:hypothetical protein